MISLYTGTPGSGKSLHLAQTIYDYNFTGRSVIANFPINVKYLKQRKHKRLSFEYWNNEKLTPNNLMNYAKENHKAGKEGQTLIIIDEAQVVFNSRSFNDKGRKEWCNFFQLHRHYGFNVVLATQNDRMIDRQIRCLCEYEFVHRKLNNFGIGGAIVGFLFMGTVFSCTEHWYGAREKIGTTFFKGKRKLYRLYDSYIDFKDLEKTEIVEEKKENNHSNSVIKKDSVKKENWDYPYYN